MALEEYSYIVLYQTLVNTCFVCIIYLFISISNPIDILFTGRFFFISYALACPLTYLPNLPNLPNLPYILYVLIYVYLT